MTEASIKILPVSDCHNDIVPLNDDHLSCARGDASDRCPGEPMFVVQNGQDKLIAIQGLAPGCGVFPTVGGSMAISIAMLTSQYINDATRVNDKKRTSRHFSSSSMTPTWFQRILRIISLALAASDADQLGRIQHNVKNPLLYVATLHTNDSDARCGATLIAPRYLVTAASCPDGLDLAILGGGRERIPVATRTNHPRFRLNVQDAFLRYNLAMITLAAPSTLAKPVEIHWGNDLTKPGTEAWTRGYQGPVTRPTWLMTEANMTILSDSVCANKYVPFVPEHMLCARGDDLDRYPGSKGESVFVVQHRDDKLIAINSLWSFCYTYRGAVYTRVSGSRDFIEPYLNAPPSTTRST
ncbi:hypothetical protein AC1031_004437 [Aphanomyces cochlioides]|nr:hypothetical protein AC1031_004437 [Aphanomyces cochlioides]